MAISQERAERIAKAHPCERCGEYSYKKVRTKAATPEQERELGVAWVVAEVCGVCGTHQEVGIDDDGDVVYVG